MFKASLILVLLLEEELISITKFATFDISTLLFAFFLALKNIVLKLLLLELVKFLKLLLLLLETKTKKRKRRNRVFNLIYFLVVN